jgi:hypothetical protein
VKTGPFLPPTFGGVGKSAARRRSVVLRVLLAPRRGASGEAVLVGVGDCLGAVANAGLGEEVVDVALDGGFADDQLAGDLGVR